MPTAVFVFDCIVRRRHAGLAQNAEMARLEMHIVRRDGFFTENARLMQTLDNVHIKAAVAVADVGLRLGHMDMEARIQRVSDGTAPLQRLSRERIRSVQAENPAKRSPSA